MRLSKMLPKVEEQLRQQIASVEAQSGRKITFHGLPYDAYIRRQWDEFDKRKEMEKRQRAVGLERQRQQEYEMMYGSRPAQPVMRKRRADHVPFTPATQPKNRKPDDKDMTLVNENRATTATVTSAAATRKPRATNRRPQMPSAAARRRPLAQTPATTIPDR